MLKETGVTSKKALLGSKILEKRVTGIADVTGADLAGPAGLHQT
jgi:hypothetical protein